MQETTLSTLSLVGENDPILKVKAETVTDFGEDLQDLLNRMTHLMLQKGGVGLAAPQVGISKRIICYQIPTRVASKGDGKPTVHSQVGYLINPTVTLMKNSGFDSKHEGCLTFPDRFVRVRRAKKILVEGFDRKGKPIKTTFDGFKARIVQHEVDHLNGITIF